MLQSHTHTCDYMPFLCLSRSSETVYECPDYHTAGENSCFFNKNDTSIWVNYNITVVATNTLGSTVSDPVDIDVMYIGEEMCAASFGVIFGLVFGCDAGGTISP